MKKLIVHIFVIVSYLCGTVEAQDLFPTPQNYGLVCDEARFLCGYELDGYSSSLLATNSPLPQPDPICDNNGSPENVQWISFVADDPNLVLEITYSNCTGGLNGGALGPGVSAGLYAGCTLSTDTDPFLDLYCETNTSYDVITIMPDPADIVVGGIYYLFIDGYAAAVCDFTIHVVSGVCVEAPPADTTCEQDCGVVNMDSTYMACTGIAQVFTFVPSSYIMEDLGLCNAFQPNAELNDIIHVDWVIEPSTGYTRLSPPMYFDSLDVVAQLDVVFDTPDVYTITPVLSINPLYKTCRSMCICTADVAYKITVKESTSTFLTPIYLCPGDNEVFCDQLYNTSTTAECVDSTNCEITYQEFIVRPRVDLPIDSQYICPGNCFTYNMVDYCTPNLFNIPVNDCDTFYQLLLVDLVMDVSLPIAESVIDCDSTTADMRGSYQTNFDGDVYEFWLNEAGDTISRTSDYVATEGGTYTYHAVPVGVEGCFQSISHMVIKDDTVPTVTATPPALDCNNPTGVIELNLTGTLASASWTGPDGFTSVDVEPTVDQGGTYEVTVIMTNNCSVTEMVEVMADFSEPVLQVSYQELDCVDDVKVASYMSPDQIVSQAWTTPAQDVINTQTLDITTAGSYALTVVGNNGCSATENFTVSDLSYDPSLGIAQQYIWRCNDVDYLVDPSTIIDPTLSYEWIAADGSPVSSDPALVATGPGTYILVSTDAALGCIGYDTVSIIEDPDPFADFEYQVVNPACEGSAEGTIDITTYIGGAGPFTYEYDGVTYGDIADIVFPIGPSSLTVYDAYQCSVTETFDISTVSTFAILLDPTISVKYGEDTTLVAVTNLPDSLILGYTWINQDGMVIGTDADIVIEGKEQIITLEVEDINGCINTVDVRTVVDYDVDIFYPNIFSPNNDGRNDRFILYNDGFPETMDALLIYDRAGELIYEKIGLHFNETQSGWDGTFNDRDLQPGVYVFLIRYTLGNGEQQSMSGTITLVR